MQVSEADPGEDSPAPTSHPFPIKVPAYDRGEATAGGLGHSTPADAACAHCGNGTKSENTVQQCFNCQSWFHPACTDEFVEAPGDLPAYCRGCASPFDVHDDNNYRMEDLPTTELSTFLQDAVRDRSGQAGIVTTLLPGCLHGEIRQVHVQTWRQMTLTSAAADAG